MLESNKLAIEGKIKISRAKHLTFSALNSISIDMVDEGTNDISSGSGIDVSESSGSTSILSHGKRRKSVQIIVIEKN